MKYLIAILRFVRGYVFFKAEKGFTERFINLCTSKNLKLWGISVQNDSLTAYVSIRNFKKLRPVVKKSGVKISIIKKNGLIFKCKQYNKRVGLAIGIIIFISIHILLNQFVWCIDVAGNDSISKEEIIEHAKLQGLDFGTYIGGFDEVVAARKIMSLYDEKIPWLSINIKGSVAVIELREKIQKINDTESNSPCNVIADFDGIILSVDTLRGDAEVIPGNGVRKGDMLINGVIVNEDLSTSYYKAKGKITALHNKKIELNKKINLNQLKLVAKNNFYSVGILGIEIPLSINSNNDASCNFSDLKHIKINDYKLPFYVIENIFVEINEEKIEKCKSVIVTSENVNYEIYREKLNSTVVSRVESVKVNKSAYNYTGEYTLIDFIGEEKPILAVKTK